MVMADNNWKILFQDELLFKMILLVITRNLILKIENSHKQNLKIIKIIQTKIFRKL